MCVYDIHTDTLNCCIGNTACMNCCWADWAIDNKVVVSAAVMEWSPCVVSLTLLFCKYAFGRSPFTICLPPVTARTFPRCISVSLKRTNWNTDNQTNKKRFYKARNSYRHLQKRFFFIFLRHTSQFVRRMLVCLCLLDWDRDRLMHYYESIQFCFWFYSSLSIFDFFNI